MLSPGATIGILGGGQLGRMTALAAARLGFRTHIYATEADSPGSQVTPLVTIGRFDDATALQRFAESVDVVTYETENIPLDTVATIQPIRPVLPGIDVLRVTQDRLLEKDFIRSIGVETAPYQAINGIDDLRTALLGLQGRAILKSVRMGYDGKGQVAVDRLSSPEVAWRQMGGEQGILEGFVDFRCEVSVIVARGVDGSVAAYPVVENHHAHHILDRTIAPARVDAAVAAAAEAAAIGIARALDVTGLLAVEMFVTRDGHVLVNELAPRPHNSGHWTMDACYTDQFEQLVRAITGLPLGSTDRHSDAEMRNLIGREVETWQSFLSQPRAKLHLYGKKEAPAGRKMGHVTTLKPRSSGA
jgi:5-(carboxyamino)imidazole ribonucleotide synthase